MTSPKFSPEGDRSIIVTQEFPASPAEVYEAFANPRILQQWICPPDWNLEVAESYPQPGGRFHYAMIRKEDNFPMAIEGTFLELTPPAGNRPGQIRHEEQYEPDMTGGPFSVRATFEASAGGTLMRVVIDYVSTEYRDILLKSDMPKTVSESYERLRSLLRPIPG
jgi:uncharacterized protein YndB with AHSA1/START domain